MLLDDPKELEFKTVCEMYQKLSPNEVDDFIKDFALWLKTVVTFKEVTGEELKIDTFKWFARFATRKGE